MSKVLITSDEVARYLRVSTSLLQKFRKMNPPIPHIRIRGRLVYDKEEVDRWLESNTIK